jgi:hypothetical protein
MDLKILQINMNHCRAAQDLLLHNASKWKCDVLIISEAYRPIHCYRWICAPTGAAIAVMNPKLKVGKSGAEEGIAWADIEDIRMCSGYVSPNRDLDTFTKTITYVEKVARGCKKLLVAGDFNAKAAAWGSKRTDQRGELLLLSAAVTDLAVVNVGDAPTFDTGLRTSVIDITLASREVAPLTCDWHVMKDEESLSDHRYISYRIRGKIPLSRGRTKEGWKAKPLTKSDRNKIVRIVDSTSSDSKLARTLHQICKAVYDLKNPHHRKGAYWWTPEIAQARKLCIAARRKVCRARRRGTCHDTIILGLRAARKFLRWEIKKSKQRKWRELIESIDRDPWGLPYQIVMGKIGRVQRQFTEEEVLAIISHLFPRSNALWDPRTWTVIEAVPPAFTQDELKTACHRLKNGKAAGPDHIPNEVLKEVAATCPNYLLDQLNGILHRGGWPEDWATADMVFIVKAGKSGDQPSDIRPLSLISCVGKLNERLIAATGRSAWHRWLGGKPIWLQERQEHN